MEEKKGSAPKGGGKKRTKRVLIGLLIGVLAVALALVLRYVYVMFINPMSAFDAPAAPTATPWEEPDWQALPTARPMVQEQQAPAATPTAEPDVLLPTATPEAVQTPTPGTAYMSNRVNVLILGWDQSPERTIAGSELYRDENNNFRSDVLMLLTVDFSSGEAHLVSVPRDTYAPLYNHKNELYSANGSWKINAAFAKGGSAGGRGFEYAMNTVGRMLGVPIDLYAGVDMQGFKAVVDAMGGVYYDVDIAVTMNGRRLEKGYQKLTGQQVLDYCRARKGISTDVGRADRQQRILFAIFEQLKSTEQLLNMPDIVRSLSGYIHTNLSPEQIAALAAFGMKLDSGKLHRHTISGEYNADTPYSSANYYLVDNAALTELMQRIFGIVIATNPRYDINFVKAEIFARDALVFKEAAEYLLSTEKVQGRAGSGAVAQLQAAAAGFGEACALREGPSGAVSVEKIQQAFSGLTAALLNACTECGVTRADVEQERITPEFYALLPVG